MHTRGGDRLWKRPLFQLSDLCDLDLDLELGHMAYRRVALINLYLYTKFRSDRNVYRGAS